MNAKNLVRLSNAVGIIAIILLVYWIFTFISIQLFGLKVFRQHNFETFYMSIFGILALMTGSLILNIMLNLTRIAEKHSGDEELPSKKTARKLTGVFVVSFPLLLCLLYGADALTSKKKKDLLVQSAQSIIEVNASKTNSLANYSFNRLWINNASDILTLLSGTDRSFPHITVIVKDSIDDSKVLLGFRSYYDDNKNDTQSPKKETFLFETTKEERDYLYKVFDQGFKKANSK